MLHDARKLLAEKARREEAGLPPSTTWEQWRDAKNDTDGDDNWLAEEVVEDEREQKRSRPTASISTCRPTVESINRTPRTHYAESEDEGARPS